MLLEKISTALTLMVKLTRHYCLFVVSLLPRRCSRALAEHRELVEELKCRAV